MSMAKVSVKAKRGPVKKSKPDLIINYNATKTAVDRNGQIIGDYHFKKNKMKWWRKLFSHLFIMSIANSFLLFKESRPENLGKKCHLYSFLVSIEKALGEKGGTLAGEKTGIRPSNRLTRNHNFFCILCRFTSSLLYIRYKCFD